MNYITANRSFNALYCFDKSKQELLMAEHRVFTTSVRFNEFQAKLAMGEAPEGHPYRTKEATYSGTIITFNPNDWNEARSIAEKRGFGESVDGILTDIIPWDDAGNINKLSMN